MKARLMFADRDFDLDLIPPANGDELVQDLEMAPVFKAMADGDKFLEQVARAALLTAASNDHDTVLWRQSVLHDAIDHEKEFRALYNIARAPLELRKSILFYGTSNRHPNLMLSSSVRLLERLRRVISDLAAFAIEHEELFASEALCGLCTTLRQDLDPNYLANMDQHLAMLHFRHGVLFSARLGPGNEGRDFVLRHFLPERWAWLKELVNGAPPNYRFSLHPRDESGARALSEISEAALASVAATTAEAADHVNAFFEMLRQELAFYIACLNLRAALRNRVTSLCFPIMVEEGPNSLAFDDLRDPSLLLSIEGDVVGNDLEAGNAPVLIVSGANQGGKSTYLRSIGLAQIMMQAGMFVTARQFSADLRDGVFTHYRRHEDRGLNSGKFDEELRRMSWLIEQVGRAPLFLFNESFAATNELEGSEISRQIVTALIKAGARIVFVTHMYALAELLAEQGGSFVQFLRAERADDGTRSFRILSGKALSTSFGRDLYRQIFGNRNNTRQAKGDKYD